MQKDRMYRPERDGAMNMKSPAKPMTPKPGMPGMPSIRDRMYRPERDGAMNMKPAVAAVSRMRKMKKK